MKKDTSPIGNDVIEDVSGVGDDQAGVGSGAHPILL
jgi:hypothetical protein